MTPTYAERLAHVLGAGQNAPEQVGRLVATIPNAPSRSKALGPNQLQWLRDHVPSFETHERQAVESEAHRKRLMEAVRS